MLRVFRYLQLRERSFNDFELVKTSLLRIMIIFRFRGGKVGLRGLRSGSIQLPSLWSRLRAIRMVLGIVLGR